MGDVRIKYPDPTGVLPRRGRDIDHVHRHPFTSLGGDVWGNGCGEWMDPATGWAGDTMRNDFEMGWVPRGTNEEVTTRVGASNQL